MSWSSIISPRRELSRARSEEGNKQFVDRRRPEKRALGVGRMDARRQNKPPSCCHVVAVVASATWSTHACQTASHLSIEGECTEHVALEVAIESDSKHPPP